MKNLFGLIAIVFTFASAHANSGHAPVYYTADFEVESVKAMCPNTIPAGAVCMGIGSIVTLKATIGCADQLIFSDVKAVPLRPMVGLYVVSVVRKSPNSDRIRCIQANVVRKTVTVGFNTENYEVFNARIESNY